MPLMIMWTQTNNYFTLRSLKWGCKTRMRKSQHIKLMLLLSLLLPWADFVNHALHSSLHRTKDTALWSVILTLWALKSYIKYIYMYMYIHVYMCVCVCVCVLLLLGYLKRFLQLSYCSFEAVTAPLDFIMI